MSTIRALQFDRFGPPSVLAVKEVPVPSPAHGEVLVRIAATSINPSDVKNVEGRLGATLPRIPGRDFAGVVVSSGPWSGKEVWGAGAGFGITRDGTHAEIVSIPSAWLAEKPSHLTMAQAAACGIPYLAAWMALVEAANLQSGERLLITGALGSVGRAATQIAQFKGAKIIGAARDAADGIIDTRSSGWVNQVKEASDGGVDVVLDAVGGPLFEDSLRCLRQGGRQIAMAATGDRRVSFDLPDFYHKLLRLQGIDTFRLEGKEIARLMNELKPGFEDGHLKPPAIEEHELDEAKNAYTAVSNGTGGRRQIIRFNY